MFLTPGKMYPLAISALWSVILTSNAFAQGTPTPGQSVNMVSGTKWPGGDPFLRQQNEPSIAVSTRNPQHLLAGANDYRTVDLYLIDQLPINQLAGDAWLGVFKSFDGGQRWQSTLLPGFPQDQSTFGTSSPMKGFAAASDPTVRAGTNGMFYYSGIALNRNTNIGGLFLARFIDLNNKENGDATQSCTPGQACVPASTTDPIRYIDTVEIDAGNAGQFIDKPWIAVDIPRSTSVTCTISASSPQNNGTIITQTFPSGNVYIAYAMFVGGTVNIRSKINFSKSSDCGHTWTKPIMISQTYDINQGTQVAVDPETGYVYVAWRVFSGSGSDPDAIVVTKSTDGGNTFTKAVPVRTLTPFTGSAGPAMFDQNTSPTEFREQTTPTLAVDDSGVAGTPGHVYVAWAERGVGPGGDARIQISSSPDAVTWSAPVPVDNSALLDDYGMPVNPAAGGRGHQLMPSMTFVGGKLLIMYYDLRLDHTLGRFTPYSAPGISFGPDPRNGQFFDEDRPFVGNAGALDAIANIFTSSIDDAPPLTQRRHTMDVMVAQATPSNGALGGFSTARLSRYDFGLPGSGDLNLTGEQLEQLRVNPPNLPMFAGGTVPFMGDYVDLGGQMFVPCAPLSSSSTCPAGWTYNNPAPSGAAVAAVAAKPAPSSPIYFGTWTTNQDVIPPADGTSWNKYTAPVPSGSISVFTGQTNPNPCITTGYEGDRNQNIYESRITQGLYVSSPQNSKPLSTTLQRAFVILVQNSTTSKRWFQLMIANQPPGAFNITGQNTPGGYASFQQAVPNQPQLPNPLPAPVTTALATIPAHSGATRTVFALSSNPVASITVNVSEIQIDANGNPILDANGNPTPVSGGLSSFIVLNADGTVPTLVDPDGAPANTGIAGVEVYTPGITHPTITVPGITHPGIQTPGITHPNPASPGITHPDYTTPGITHPGVPNQSPSAGDIANTSIANSGISATSGSDMLTDATYTVTNQGNTSAAYIIKLAGQLSGANANVPLQLAVTQTYTTQTAINCALTPVGQDTTNVNVATPGITHPDQFSTPGITHPAPTDATILLAPGDTAQITLRGQTDTQTMATIVSQISAVAVPQAVNTNSSSSTPFSTPVITTTSLPDGVRATPYSAQLQVAGGVPPFTWAVTSGSLPLQSVGNLTLDPASGIISGTPGCPRGFFCKSPAIFTFTVQVADSAVPTPNTASQQLTIRIANPLTVLTTSFPPAVQGSSYSNSVSSIGGIPPITWSAVSGLPPGVNVNNNGTITGAPTSAGAFNVQVQAMDSSSPQQLTANATIPLTVFGTGINILFTQQPTQTAAGVSISPAVKVLFQDNSGAVIPNSGVNIAIGNNPSGGTLSGTLITTTDVNGNAMFANLSIDTPGSGYTLVAWVSVGGVSLGAASNTFNIFEAPPTNLTAMAASSSVTLNWTGTISPVVGYNVYRSTNSGGPFTLLAQVGTLTYTDNTVAGAATYYYQVTALGLNNAESVFSNQVSVTTAAASFGPTGAMGFNRQFHTISYLPNGKVLVAGGEDTNSHALSTAEVYDPSTGTFTATAGNMVQPRSGHTATLLTAGPNAGKVLIAGGITFDQNGNQVSQGNAELYDPTANTFAALPLATIPGESSTMGCARAFHTATMLNNGKILFTGGQTFNPNLSLSCAELFDPAQGGGFMRIADMTTARSVHTATLLPNGKVLIVGGVVLSNANSIASAEIYDPGNTITPFAQTTGSLSTSRSGHTATLLDPNTGRVLIAGGLQSNGAVGFLNTLKSAEIYDPATDRFTTSTGTMSVDRFAHTAIMLTSGKVLLAGGLHEFQATNTSVFNGSVTNTADLYDPISDTFTATASMSTARYGHAAVRIDSNGNVVVTGGVPGINTPPVNSAEVYVP